MIFNKPSLKLQKTYLTSPLKENEKDFKKEFTTYLSQVLHLVYEDDDKSIKTAVKEPFFTEFWKRAFVDETSSVKNYEILEFYGDSVFSYSFTRYIYMQFKDNLDKNNPATFNNLSNYFESKESMVEMANNLNMSDWIIIGNGQVNITDKMRSNLIESFFGALDFVSRAVKNMYIQNKEYEKAARIVYGPEAGYKFIENYFKQFVFDEERANVNEAKAFFTDRLPGVLGSKGKMKFIKIDDSKKIYKFFIDPSFIETLINLVGKSDEAYNNKLRKLLLNLNKDKRYTSEDQNKLAYDIKKNIFEKELGINDKWLSNYKDLNKLDTIPEPYRTQLIKQEIEGKRYTTIKFEVPTTQATNTEKTVIMYKIVGDTKGNTISKEILDIITGPHTGPTFPIELKNNLVKQYLSKIDFKN